MGRSFSFRGSANINVLSTLIIGMQQVYVAGWDPLIKAGWPGPIQSTSAVRKVCLVGPTTSHEGVFLHNSHLLETRLLMQAFQILGLPNVHPLNASISQWIQLH